jgi:hypothetical protein
MADLLASSSSWLSAMFRAHASTSVTYWRGSSSVAINTTVGRSERLATAEDGVQVKIESVDFLVDTADLVVDGVEIRPRSGDRITRSVGGQELTYAVAPLAGEPEFSFIDSTRDRMRVHTKRLDTREI